MREIKFRAWDKKQKIMACGIEKMYDGGNIKDSNGKKIDEYELTGCPIDAFYCFLDNDDFELMQFTGLKDKNGKEIFEGDIIKGIWGKNEIDIFEVFWVDNGWWGKDKDSHYSFGDYHTFEVIGNIYENPELLEDKE